MSFGNIWRVRRFVSKFWLRTVQEDQQGPRNGTFSLKFDISLFRQIKSQNSKFLGDFISFMKKDLLVTHTHGGWMGSKFQCFIKWCTILKFIYEIQFDERCLSRVVLAYFDENSISVKNPNSMIFWKIYVFCLICSVKTFHFSMYMTLLWDQIFFARYICCRQTSIID